jgi:hypothetical protein
MRDARGKTIGVSIAGLLTFELPLLRELAAPRGHVEDTLHNYLSKVSTS